MNKKVLYVMLPAIILVLSATAATAVFANFNGNGQSQMSALITRIAEKFNLDQNSVQSVFDEYSSEMRTSRQADIEEERTQREESIKSELSQAVKDGKITQNQMDLILAKRAELQSERPLIMNSANNSSMTKDELEQERETRRAEMQTKQEELKQWADNNGIPQEYLRYAQGFGFGNFGGHGNRGPGRVMGANGFGSTQSSSDN